MPDGRERFHITILEGLDGVSAQEWDACAGTANPFVSHAFLSALEDAGCVTAETGWAPHHVVIKNQNNAVVACAPMYLKGNSMGEYVFDWNWAEAYQRAGGNYYPKLVCAVPFTPVTGPRLLVHPNIPSGLASLLKRQLVDAMAQLASQAGLSSLHVNFIPERDLTVFDDQSFLVRMGLQYHWTNHNYQSYDDFLATLTSRKRKALKKERRMAQADVTIRRLKGDDIQPHHWDGMYAFYMDTSARKWGRPYLNREFFDLLDQNLRNQTVLIMVEQDRDLIAGALNFLGDDTLYGRYWGCKVDVPYLHFEVCYHQAIDAAIELGLKRVEAGAQGEHKIARGYLPTRTHSAHFITDPKFRDAIAHFLDHETKAIIQEFDTLKADSPYRQS